MNAETTLSSGECIHGIEHLIEISRTTSALLDLEPFLNLLIATTSELTGCETGLILELEKDGEVVNKTGETHYTEEDLLLLPVNPEQANAAKRVFEP